MYKSFLYLTGKIKQQSSVWKTQVSTGQLQIRWDEILIWMIYIGVSRFPVRYRLYVFMVNELSLVADIFVEKLALVVFKFLYTKRSENETIQVSSKSTNKLSFFFFIVFFFFLQCSGTRDETFFFLTSFLWKLKYHKIWYLICIISLILINSDSKWSWRTWMKLEQSLPGTNPRKCRFWKKNTIQTCNKNSTA